MSGTETVSGKLTGSAAFPGHPGVPLEAHRTGVLVLTMFEDDDSVFAAMRAGARGYLVKGSDTGEVIQAITAVGNGQAIFGPPVARRILAFLTRPLSAYDQQIRGPGRARGSRRCRSNARSGSCRPRRPRRRPTRPRVSGRSPRRAR
jgi:hypothetical protein